MSSRIDLDLFRDEIEEQWDVKILKFQIFVWIYAQILQRQLLHQ